LGRFDRYMLSQLMTLFGFFSLVLVMVYWINRAVILFDQLIADGQSAGVFLAFTALSLPQVITIVLPLSAFAASLYVTNRMSNEAELTVVQATGFSPFRIARPVALFGLIVTLLMSALVHVLAPAALTELNAREAEIAGTATSRLLREGTFITPVDGITVYIREITPGGELQDIFLSDQRADSEKVTYTAARAYLIQAPGGPQLVMVDGNIQTLRAAERQLVTTGFTDLVYNLAPLLPEPGTARRSSREFATPALLDATPETVALTRKSAETLHAEAHDRVAETLLALVAALLGFATLLVGQFSRFGVWRQVVGAIFLVIFVKGIETLATAAIRDAPDRWWLAYMPVLVGLAIVWGLLTRATRPMIWRPRRPATAGATAP
jgi:lipopolysaccharide export system permease protein